MSDFTIQHADFSATTFTVIANTPEAKASLGGGISFEVPKSNLPKVAAEIACAGLTIK